MRSLSVMKTLHGSPEEIEDAYKKLKEDDDSVKTHQGPRYKDAKFITF